MSCVIICCSRRQEDVPTGEKKKKLLVKVRCSLATFAKRATICIVYAAAAALNWTTLWTAIVKDVSSHSLDSFDKERGRQEWTISNFKAKFRKDASSSSYLLIGQSKMQDAARATAETLVLLYVANYQLHLTLPRWLLQLLFRWLLLVVDLEKWKRKW